MQKTNAENKTEFFRCVCVVCVHNDEWRTLNNNKIIAFFSLLGMDRYEYVFLKCVVDADVDTNE